MSINKSTTQLKKLLERESQIQTTLSNLTPAETVEDAAQGFLAESEGNLSPATAVAQAQHEIAEKTALEQEAIALEAGITEALKALKTALDKQREKARSEADSAELKAFKNWMQDAAELIEDAKARQKVFILTSAAEPVLQAVEKLAAIPLLHIQPSGQVNWQVRCVEAPTAKALEVRTPLTRPATRNKAQGDRFQLSRLLDHLNV
jgi:mannose/fructose/N-acetylgalactosamine-specific phosphotransferase system component IIB